MYKILLACNAGMSTSLLVTRMQEAAKEQGIDAEIKAVGVSIAQQILNDGWDIVLLGPQVRYQLNTLNKASHGVPVEVISMTDYGLMNGKNVLESALSKLNK